jgi:hypothetical protein
MELGREVQFGAYNEHGSRCQMESCGSETNARRGFPSDRPRRVSLTQSYFPANKSLAMVASCMLDVPS